LIGRELRPGDAPKLPVAIPPEEIFIWLPILAEPPLANLREMQDGTYSIDDVLSMNIMLKLKQLLQQQAMEKANTHGR